MVAKLAVLRSNTCSCLVVGLVPVLIDTLLLRGRITAHGRKPRSMRPCRLPSDV